MKKTHYTLLFLLSTVVLSWVLPWLYNLCFSERDREPFVSYSPIIDRLIVTDFQNSPINGEPLIFDVDPINQQHGETYSMDQRDSLLPEIFVGQLSAKGQLPDSIKGVAVSMRDIRLNSWIFSSSPQDLNRSVPTVYPLMESMPARFKFEDPEVILTLDDEVKVIDIQSNSIDPNKTRRFAKMFNDKHFAFPAKEAVANITSRKGYDNGYLIIDNNNNLFHLKMQAGRPSMAHILLNDSIVPVHVFVMENADKKLYGLISDTNNNLYALNHDESYSLSKLSGVTFDPEKDKISIVKNLFSWCVKIRSGNSVRWIALDPDNYEVLARYDYSSPITLEQNVKKWIFPFTTTFTSSDDKFVYPRVSNFSYYAIILNFVLMIIVVATSKGQSSKLIVGKSVLTLITGLFAFIPLMLFKKINL